MSQKKVSFSDRNAVTFGHSHIFFFNSRFAHTRGKTIIFFVLSILNFLFAKRKMGMMASYERANGYIRMLVPHHLSVLQL